MPLASLRGHDVAFETIRVHLPSGASDIDTYWPHAVRVLPNFANEPTLVA